MIPVKCAQVTLTLHGDLSHFIDGSDHRRDFEAGLRAEVAEVLGILPERVRLVSLKAGSIIATLQIDEDKALSESDLDDLVDYTGKGKGKGKRGKGKGKGKGKGSA